MAKDFAHSSQLELAYDRTASSNGAFSKLVKAWESKNGERAVRGAGLGLMALSLAACGGTDSGTTATTTTPVTTPATPVAPAGQSFVLTTGVDNFTGGAGNDTFVADDTQTAKVTSAADMLDGGAGIDSLTIYGTPNGIPLISNIEIVEVDSMANTGAANFSTISGIQTVIIDRAVGAATVSVNNGVAVTLSNNAISATQTVNFGSTDTTASLTLNKISTLTGVDVALTGAAVSTVNIATTGAASSIGNLNLATTMKTVNVSGNQDLTVVDALDGDLDVLNASSLTGKLNVTSANNAATQDDAVSGVDVTDLAITGGSGDDSINVAANVADNEISVDAGAGNDTVTIKAGTAYTAATSTNAGDSIKGGAGTDILAVAGNINASDMSAAITGFETIKFTAAATGTSMSVNKLGITDFQLSGTGTDVVLSGLTAATTVKISDDGSDLTASLAALGTADTLTVTLESTSASGSILIANSHDVVNIVSTKASTDAATVVNELENTTSATSAATLNISGDTELTIQSAALKADASVNAASMSGKLTSTFSTAVQSYTGGTGVDTLSLVAGGLKQGNIFDGGAGADSLTVAATSAQNMGIIGLSGFETVNLASSGAGTDTVIGDFRNVTNLTTLKIVGGDVTDNFTLNRLSADTVVSFGGTVANVVTTLNSGTSQQVAFHAAGTVGSLALDAATTSLTVTSDDGDATTAEAMGVVTVSGNSLASITVLGNDDLNLNTLANTVTAVDASASKGNLTVTASDAVNTSIIGSQVADNITGGAKDDTITGGKGDDVLSGAGGHDTFVFADTGLNNGADTLTFTAGAGASGDILNFTNFLSGGHVDQNGGTGTALVAYGAASNSDVNITNVVALYTDATETNIANSTQIAALIEGAGDAFSLTAGGRTILVTGDAASALDSLNIWFVDDALDGVSGTVSATDVVHVGTMATTDLDTLITSNFVFA